MATAAAQIAARKWPPSREREDDALLSWTKSKSSSIFPHLYFFLVLPFWEGSRLGSQEKKKKMTDTENVSSEGR